MVKCGGEEGEENSLLRGKCSMRNVFNRFVKKMKS